MNAKTGAILFERKAHEGVYPASIARLPPFSIFFILTTCRDEIIRCEANALIMKGKSESSFYF